MITLVFIANIVAPLISMSKLAPQALKTFKERNSAESLNSLSIVTQWAVVLSSVLWIMLGINLNSVTVYLPTIFQLLCSAVVIILIKRKTERKTYFVACITVLLSLIIYTLIFGLNDFQMLLVNIIAPILSFGMFVPQAILTWKNRNNDQYAGVSVWTQILIIINAISWGIVGWDLSSFAVMAPGLVNLPLAVFTVIIILRNKNKARTKIEINKGI